MAGRRQRRSAEDIAVPASLTATVVRGVALSGGGHLLTQALTLGIYLALARLATPDEFGEFAAGTVLVGIGLLFTESGMLAAVVQRRDRLDEAAATAVASTFAAGLGFGLLALALSPAIGAFFDSDQIGAVAAASAGLLLLRTLSVVPNALLQRRFSFVRRTVVEPISVIAFGAAAIAATAGGLGVWGLVIGQYASALADVALSWGLVRWRPQMGLASFGMWRELIGYGRNVFAATAIHRAGLQIPVALLGRYVGEAPLGQFRYASRLASTPYAAILAAGSFVLFPAFARISADPERLRAAFLRALGWMAVIGVPAGLILLPLGEPMAVLVFGSVWEEAGEAAMALCLYPAAGALFTVVSETFTANGRPDLLLRMHGLEVGLWAILMAALLPLGLIGVAAGLSLGVVGATVYSLLLAQRVVGVTGRAVVREVGPPLVAGAVMAAAILPLERLVVNAADHATAIGLLALAAEGAAALAIYGVVLHLLAPGRIGELGRLVRMARRREPREAEPEAGSAEAVENRMVDP